MASYVGGGAAASSRSLGAGNSGLSRSPSPSRARDIGRGDDATVAGSRGLRRASSDVNVGSEIVAGGWRGCGSRRGPSTSPPPGADHHRSPAQDETFRAAYAAHAAYAARAAQATRDAQNAAAPCGTGEQHAAPSHRSVGTGSTGSGSYRTAGYTDHPESATEEIAALADECARLRLERADERRRREAAEREVMELRRRLKLATDECQGLRYKCMMLETEVVRQGRCRQRRERPNGMAADESEEEPVGFNDGDYGCEKELYAIEGAVDKLCEQRMNLTQDLEGVRRQLLQVLSATGG